MQASATEQSLYTPVQGAEHCRQLLEKGPLEFFLGAEVSPSLRALRFAYDDEQMWSVDLALALYQKYILCAAHGGEHPKDLLLELLEAVSPFSALSAEAHCLLGVYFADENKLERSLHHYQTAVDIYGSLGREDALLCCFLRHSISMAEQGKHGASAASLLQAMSLAPKVDRTIYKQYCHLAQLQVLYFKGQLLQAGLGAAELRLTSSLGPAFNLQMLAIQYASSVEQGDSEKSEEIWFQIVGTGVEVVSNCSIAILARVRSLLGDQRFSDASEVALAFLQSATLTSDQSRYSLVKELMDSEVVTNIPEALKFMFKELMMSYETASTQDERIDLDLKLKLSDEA